MRCYCSALLLLRDLLVRFLDDAAVTLLAALMTLMTDD